MGAFVVVAAMLGSALVITGLASAASPPHRVALPAAGSVRSALSEARASLRPSPSTVPPGTPGCAGVDQANYPEVSPSQRALKEACAYAAARASVSQPGWVSDSHAPPSFYLYDFALTYDSSDGYVLLFGDPILPSASAPTETWTYRGGNWSEVDTNGNSPTSCLSSALANDPTDGYVVYFAGLTMANGSACPSAGQTWTYHGGVWTELTPARSPAARSSASFTNDSASGDLLLFGGLSRASLVLGDTWTFSAGAWTPLSPTTAPSNRSAAGMTYDAKDGYVLLFGGEGQGANLYTMYNDTWKFSGGNWTNITPLQAPSPPTPQPDGLAYDPADGYTVYTQICWNFSGPYGPSEMIWGYSGGSWTKLNGSCAYSSGRPTQRVGEGTTYDAADGYFLLFGGGGPWQQSPELHDTWSWASGNWTNRSYLPPTPGLPEYGGAVTYDDSEGAVVVFGGSTGGGYTNATWERSGGNWTELPPAIAPSPRVDAAFAYDPADGYAVLFGGTNNTALGDTWEFLAGSWTELTPVTAPSPRSSPQMVYDAADGYLVLFGGGPYPDTWTFHAGTWTNISATAGTPSKNGYLQNPLAYDATDRYVVLFGPANGATLTNETWTFAAGVWTNRTGSSSPAPTPRQGAALAGMGPGGGVVLFSGYCWVCGYTSPADTWLYENGSWVELVGAVGPEARLYALFVYDPGTKEGTLYGGYTLGGDYLHDTWYWVANAGASPFLTAFHATRPTVDAGTSTSFVSTVLGGTLPLTYSYAGLPGGCASANVTSLPCTPASGSSGVFDVTVRVTDALGNVTGGSTSLTVHASPSVGSFRATPSVVNVSSRTILRTSVQNGTSPYVYAYLGLPGGCFTQTVPALPCVPSSSGSFNVTVRITDADNESANASLALTVQGLVSGALTVSGFAASPPQFVLGNSTYLNVTANSTSGPLSYSYTGLPTGCSTANVSSLLCTPTASGTFSVRAAVSDSAGDVARVTTNVTVYAVGSPWLERILSFGITPSSITLGGSVVLYVVATGGNGTLDYAYLGLPPGCASRDAVALDCTPTAVGSYTVTFEVEDQSGHLAELRAALTVGSPPSNPPGGTTKVPTTAGGAATATWVEVGLGAVAAASLVALVVLRFRPRPPQRSGTVGPSGSPPAEAPTER